MDGYQKLREQIKSGTFDRAYLFHGQETYLRDHILGQLKKALLPEGLDSFNLHSFEGKGVSLPDIQDVVDTIPVMSQYKLVLLWDIDLYKLKEADRQPWLDFFASVPEDCVLVVIYDILPYKPDKRTKLYTALQKCLTVVEFALQETKPLCHWIMRHFSALDKTIHPQTCEYLIFRCGHLMTALAGEIAKTAAYASGSVITEKDIDAVVVPILEAVTFDLTDAVMNRESRKAAELLMKLQYLKNPPEMILGALSKTLRGLYAARLALHEGRSVRSVMEICGYRSTYPAEKLMKAAGKRSLDWCANALRLCREADAQLKGESSERERVMEWMLASLI